MESDTQEDQQQHRKRVRILQACDYCRQKKIKCNGSNPCQNCTHYGSVCLYTHAEKVQVSKKRSWRSSNSKNINELGDRLSKMEGLMELLVSRLEGGNQQLIQVAPPDTKNKCPSGVSVDLPPNSSDEKPFPENIRETGSLNSSSNSSLSANSTYPAGPSQPTNPSYFTGPSLRTEGLASQSVGIPGSAIPPTHESSSVIALVGANENEVFISSNSTYSVLSPRGLFWLRSKVKDPQFDPFLPMMKAHQALQRSLAETSRIWEEPVAESALVPLPPRDVCLRIINHCYRNRLDTSNVVPEGDAHKLLAAYFDFKEYRSKRRLRYDEHLVLRALIVNGTAVMWRAEDLQPPTHDPTGPSANDSASSPLLDSSHPRLLQDLKVIERQNLQAAVYYYHRFALTGAGISGVQGVLLLAMYADMTVAFRVTYMLFSTATRLAQDIGLHRRESFHGLSTEEADKRRNIWLVLHKNDMEICLKAFTPPIINDNDVSTLTPRDYRDALDALKSKDNMGDSPVLETGWSKAQIIEKHLLELASSSRGFNVFTSYYLNRLSALTSKLYNELGVANAFSAKTPTEHKRTVRALSAELREWRDTICEGMRPGLPINLGKYAFIGDGTTPAFRHCLVLLLHFGYHYRMIWVNQMYYQYNIANQDACIANFNVSLEDESVQICVHSSKEILRLSQSVDKEDRPFFFHASFYIFVASVHLTCTSIVIPTHPQAVENLHLVIDVCKTFIMDKSDTRRDGEAWHSEFTFKQQFASFCIRLLVLAAARTIEETTGKRVITPELEAFLDIKDFWAKPAKRPAKQSPKTQPRVTAETKQPLAPGVAPQGRLNSPSKIAHLIHPDPCSQVSPALNTRASLCELTTGSETLGEGDPHMLLGVDLGTSFFQNMLNLPPYFTNFQDPSAGYLMHMDPSMNGMPVFGGNGMAPPFDMAPNNPPGMYFGNRPGPPDNRSACDRPNPYREMFGDDFIGF